LIFEFDLPHVFFPESSSVDNAYALRALLQLLINLNEAYLRNHAVRDLYSSGVVYGRTRVWDTIPALYKRGYGDCKSLSAALIAQRHKEGIPAKPVFRWVRRPQGVEGEGTSDYHILVLTPNGFEDPSKKLGMETNALY
jgi:hypothetical protein